MNGLPPDTDKYEKYDVVEVSFDGRVIMDEVCGDVWIQVKRKDGLYENLRIPAEFVMIKKNEFEARMIREGRA